MPYPARIPSGGTDIFVLLPGAGLLEIGAGRSSVASCEGGGRPSTPRTPGKDIPRGTVGTDGVLDMTGTALTTLAGATGIAGAGIMT